VTRNSARALLSCTIVQQFYKGNPRSDYKLKKFAQTRPLILPRFHAFVFNDYRNQCSLYSIKTVLRTSPICSLTEVNNSTFQIHTPRICELQLRAGVVCSPLQWHHHHGISSVYESNPENEKEKRKKEERSN
jgi:hypothetical protein